MAVVVICHGLHCQNPSTAKEIIKPDQRIFRCEHFAIQELSGCKVQNATGDVFGKSVRRDAWTCSAVSGGRIRDEGLQMPRKNGGKQSLASCISYKILQSPRTCRLQTAASSTEKQLLSLDSYFERLQDDANKSFFNSLTERSESLDVGNPIESVQGLRSLDDYLWNVSGDVNLEDIPLLTSDEEAFEAASYSSARSYGGVRARKLIKYAELKVDNHPQSSIEDPSSLYLVGSLASINIAVFLFEIASPIRNSVSGLLSFPLVYGAKINHLILVGEWWRLVTPMFLHSGILHVAFGCWALLSFGPRVCRIYGSFTFLLIYILGGISGNLTSFLHTPDPTVGGTGPVFAVMGAWLIYQMQSRDVIEKDASESMFQKAIIAVALSFVLNNFGLIDDWTHVGAAFTGIVYGFLTCPTLQVDDASSKAGQEEGIAIVSRNADSCKSLAYFSLFILVLSSLLFVVKPPLD